MGTDGITRAYGETPLDWPTIEKTFREHAVGVFTPRDLEFMLLALKSMFDHNMADFVLREGKLHVVGKMPTPTLQ